MGAEVSRKEFEWVGSDEPHASRRKLILSKHPEIKSLMGVDTWFKWKVLLIVAFQLTSFYFISKIQSIWLLMLIGYAITGTLNHSLSLAIHEIAHGQAFGTTHVLANKLFGYIANLPLGFPVSVSFKKYHLEHHRYQGIDVIDTDIPSNFEVRWFRRTLSKLLWVVLQPLFYALRPLLTNPKPPQNLELVNSCVQLAFDYLIAATLGWHMIAYIVFSTLVALGLHPIAGHFISEHYIMFKEEEVKKKLKVDEPESKGNLDDLLIPETCSYYGPLNLLTFNVGYHVEHHDFPSIPGSRLPKVKEMAPEFYDDLCQHTSWTKVIWRYIMDPSIGPASRVKRLSKKVPFHEDNDDAYIEDAAKNK